MTTYIDDWTKLIGHGVEIHERGRIVDQGRIDDAMKDGSILWIAQQGANPRRLWEMLPERYLRVLPVL